MSLNGSTRPVFSFLITAAGSGLRMGDGPKKEFRLLHNKTVLQSTIEAFLKSDIFSYGLVTCKAGTEETVKDIISTIQNTSSLKKTVLLCEGGADRQESVFRGLCFLNKTVPELSAGSFVLIHDGARPWVSGSIITAVTHGCLEYGACAPVIPSVDAMKTIDSSGIITEHLVRSSTVGIQTPQGFSFNEILQAHESARHDGKMYIDDTEIYNTYIGRVHTVPGELQNRKITYASDLPDAQSIGSTQ